MICKENTNLIFEWFDKLRIDKWNFWQMLAFLVMIAHPYDNIVRN